MTDANFQNWQREKYASALAALTPEQINADPALLAAVMAAELHALETCDAIYLLDGWHKSEGARKELATAIAYGLKIYLAPVVYIPLIRREQAQGEQ